MSSEENTMDEQAHKREASLLQQHWHGWGSPVGLGLFLLLLGGFIYLLAEGLAVLNSI